MVAARRALLRAFAAGTLGRALAVTMLAPVLASCGFHLRGAATYSFQTIFVNAAAAPPLGNALVRALGDTGSAKVVTDPKNAQVILDIVSQVDDKEVLSLSQSGAVREYELIRRVSFRVHDANGVDWLPPGEIVVRRTYSFNESEVLAREAQEQRLLREMQQDVVQQLVRRLQAAHKP
jgi:LPS-assembly lipoprotein